MLQSELQVSTILKLYLFNETYPAANAYLVNLALYKLIEGNLKHILNHNTWYLYIQTALRVARSLLLEDGTANKIKRRISDCNKKAH
jgi:hypothetical protein